MASSTNPKLQAYVASFCGSMSTKQTFCSWGCSPQNHCQQFYIKTPSVWWWASPLIPALGDRRTSSFEIIPVYRMGTRTGKATEKQNPPSKTQNLMRKVPGHYGGAQGWHLWQLPAVQDTSVDDILSVKPWLSWNSIDQGWQPNTRELKVCTSNLLSGVGWWEFICNSCLRGRRLDLLELDGCEPKGRLAHNDLKFSLTSLPWLALFQLPIFSTLN